MTIDDQAKFIGIFHDQLREGVRKRSVGVVERAGKMLDGDDFKAIPERLQEAMSLDYAKALLQASAALVG